MAYKSRNSAASSYNISTPKTEDDEKGEFDQSITQLRWTLTLSASNLRTEAQHHISPKRAAPNYFDFAPHIGTEQSLARLECCSAQSKDMLARPFQGSRLFETASSAGFFAISPNPHPNFVSFLAFSGALHSALFPSGWCLQARRRRRLREPREPPQPAPEAALDGLTLPSGPARMEFRRC